MMQLATQSSKSKCNKHRLGSIQWTNNDFHWLSKVLANFTVRIYLVEISLHTEPVSSPALVCTCAPGTKTDTVRLSLFLKFWLLPTPSLAGPSSLCPPSRSGRIMHLATHRQTEGGCGCSGRNKWRYLIHNAVAWSTIMSVQTNLSKIQTVQPKRNLFRVCLT